MTLSEPLANVVTLLESAGYRSRPQPFTVASVPFDFSALLVGAERALDLIVVVDTLVESEVRIRQKVEGLSRALDLVASRRPLTTIVVGPLLPAATIAALSKVSRVLSVGVSVGEEAERYLGDALAVLLPLTLPDPSQAVLDPLAEVGRVMNLVAEDDGTVASLLDAAANGPETVREVFRTEMLEALIESGRQEIEADENGEEGGNGSGAQ